MSKRSKTILKVITSFMTRKHHIKMGPHKLGFTIIELLVVMGLLAILSVSGLWAFREQIAKSRDARRKTDLQKISQALSNYFDDFQAYPEVNVVTTCDGTGLRPYLPNIPCDPVNSGIYKYVYEPNQSRNYYTLKANMEKDSIGVYQITSDGGAGKTNNEEGVPATCGSGTKYCYPGVCGSCCPGTNYRCGGSGHTCIIDTTCSK